MRVRIAIVLALVFGASALSQEKDKEPPRRFGIKVIEELYPQQTPKQTLTSVLEAIGKERYDYLVAHLLDPAFVDDQLEKTIDFFSKDAYARAEKDGWMKPPYNQQLVQARIAELAKLANVEYLNRRIRTKFADDPQSLVELKRMLREGDVEVGGNTAIYRLKDVKDKQLYFKKIGNRWFVEDRTTDEAAKP